MREMDKESGNYWVSRSYGAEICYNVTIDKLRFDIDLIIILIENKTLR